MARTKKAQQKEAKTIDAAGRPIGRLASEIAGLLQGKNRVDYAPNADLGCAVEVRHAAKAVFTGRKMEQKVYYHFSGYPGGLKETLAKKIAAVDPSELIRRAVRNMLPKNRLQKGRLKRLVIHND